MDSPTPLVPDDRPPLTVDLPVRNAQAAQPYGMAALEIGLLLLLVTKIALPGQPLSIHLAFAGTATVLCYLAFISARPKLPLLSLVVGACELGLLYSLPSQLIFSLSTIKGPLLASLVAWLVFTGILGLFLGILLAVERFPQQVIIVAFLTVFVVMNALFMFLPLLTH